MLGWSLSCLFSFSKLHPIGKLVVMYFVLVISILPVFIIFLMDFGDVRTVWYFWRCLDSVVLLGLSNIFIHWVSIFIWYTHLHIKNTNILLDYPMTCTVEAPYFLGRCHLSHFTESLIYFNYVQQE
jgi:hypothetical protein